MDDSTVEANPDDMATAEEGEETEEAAEGGDDEAQQPAAADDDSSDDVLKIVARPTLDSLYGLREIGREALCWQLSSAKPGNGVQQLRDQAIETYWQSDGTSSQSHYVQVHFGRRVCISHVCLYLDYNLDESYTPRQISISTGLTTTQDLQPAVYPHSIVEFHEPNGWCIIPLRSTPDPLDSNHPDNNGDDNDDPMDQDGTSDDDFESSSKRNHSVRTHLIQISILHMHQNGRDTHVRQVQLYGPRTAASALPSTLVEFNTSKLEAHANNENDVHERTPGESLARLEEEFSTLSMSQFSVLR